MWESAVDASKLRAYKARVPTPFDSNSKDLSLEDLFAARRFGEALERTTYVLGDLEAPETNEDLTKVLQVWYIRLRILLQLKLGIQAAEEYTVCLNELDGNEARALQDRVKVIWDLRLLLAPAAAKGINNNAIQRYYLLAGEARHFGDDDRVKAAGQSVVAALLSMRDFASALDLLKSLYRSESDAKIAEVITLIYIQVGDTISAREWVPLAPNDHKESLGQLCAFADDESATGVFSKLYNGHVADAVTELEAHAAIQPVPAITNLVMLYDLQHADSSSARRKLADRLKADGRNTLETYAFLSGY